MADPISPGLIALGSIYNLNMKAVPVFGQKIENVKVVAIMDYDTAMLFSPVDAVHATVVAAQVDPNAIPASCATSTFFKLVPMNNPTASAMYISAMWITGATLVSKISLTVTLEVADSAARSLLDAAFAAMYPAITVTNIISN